MIKAALFDVDGTLLDTTEFIYQAFEYTFKMFGLPSIPRAKIRGFIGKPLIDCYKALAPFEDILKLMEEHRLFQLKNLHLSVPFKNTEKTLMNLKTNKVKLVAITTRSKHTSILTLKQAGILELFNLVISGEDVKQPKPNPEGINKALDIIKVKPSSAVMIGDTAVDVQAGKNAGIKTIGVTHGFHGRKVKESKPDYCIDDIQDILPIILE